MLETVKFHFNNKHNFDNSWNLFSVSLKFVNVSANVLWGLSILFSLRLRTVGEEHTLQNRALIAPQKTCLDEG